MAALGELQLRKGDLKEACRSSQDIERVEPNHPMATLLEAEIAFREKRFAAAAEGIATANGGAQSAALVLRELTVGREANLPDPEITLTRWLKAHPNDTPVVLALAEVRLGERQIPAALRLYDGEHAKALEILSSTRKRSGAIPDLDHHYAAALVGLEWRDEAMTVLDEPLFKHPKFQSRSEAETRRASLD